MNKDKLNATINTTVTEKKILINIAKQTLELYATSPAGGGGQKLIRRFDVSTAKNGIGNLEGTGCTPLGHHVIADKIGAEHPMNTVFVGRVPTGEIYTASLGRENPDRDWILSRILWLQGVEEGVNCGSNELGCCDSHQRYIYIHGTPDTEPMGVPMSHGCIRMRNQDIIWLFDQVEVNTPVHIIAK